jgi:hypothetical protein
VCSVNAEGPTQERVAVTCDSDIDKLSGKNRPGDQGGMETENVGIARDLRNTKDMALLLDHSGITVFQHPAFLVSVLELQFPPSPVQGLLGEEMGYPFGVLRHQFPVLGAQWNR